MVRVQISEVLNNIPSRELPGTRVLARPTDPPLRVANLPKRTPEADYNIRLSATLVAQQLWQNLSQGSWRCRHYEKLESALGARERWNEEDWSLELLCADVLGL